MPTPEKRRLLILGGGGLLATGGIVWLVIAARDHAPQWAAAAALSPLAVRCLVFIVGGMVILGGLGALLAAAAGGRRPAARALHGDEGGTAAIEMALLFPFALMVFLTVTQAALLFNANMVVHYAAFSAARMATVVVPMEINDEYRNLVYGPNQGTSEKREMIRRAAVLALVPISARLTSSQMGEGDQFLPGAETDVQNEVQRVMSHSKWADNPGWLRRVAAQYAYADGYVTLRGGRKPVTEIQLAPPDHWQDGNPDPDCPYRHHKREEDWYLQPEWWNAYEPFCPYYHRDLPIWDYWYWEMLDVKLTYRFLLQVPYAARFLGESAQVPGMKGKQFVEEIVVVGSLSNEGAPELRPPGGVRSQPMW